MCMLHFEEEIIVKTVYAVQFDVLIMSESKSWHLWEFVESCMFEATYIYVEVNHS